MKARTVSLLSHDIPLTVCNECYAENKQRVTGVWRDVDIYSAQGFTSLEKYNI